MNKVILIGRLTKDVEVRKTQSDLSVVSFTVACDRHVKDGEKTADFINCVAWRQAADYLAQYSKKGYMVALEGKLQVRAFDGKDGKKVYVTEVHCDNVQIISRPDHKVENQEAKQEVQTEMLPFGKTGELPYRDKDGFHIPAEELPFY